MQERDSVGNWSPSGKASAVLAVLKPIADYPLDGHAFDTLGGNAEMTLSGTPFLSQGIYLNGIGGGSAGQSGAWSPPIAGFDTLTFAAEVDFKIDSLPAAVRPILFGGPSYRWLGGVVGPDGKIGMVYNNSNNVAGSLVCSVAQWHTLRIEYAAGVAKVYLDGAVSASVTAKLQYGTDYEFGAGNPSNGTVFKGYWRNLRVYSTGARVAQFPLSSTLTDVTKIQTGTMSLTNAPFQGPGPGISCGGLYGTNNAVTPILTAMNMDDFKITMDFSIAALPGGPSAMTILMGGDSYRWMGAAIDPAGKLTLIDNNASTVPTSIGVSLNDKHTAVLRYSAVSQTASIFLDGVLAGSQSIASLIHNNNKNIGITNFSNGTTFKGNLYRVRVDSK